MGKDYIEILHTVFTNLLLKEEIADVSIGTGT